MHRAELIFELNSEVMAIAVWKALIPESKVTLRNVRVYLSLSGKCLNVSIEAEDESALRATLNSLTRLTYLALEAIKTTGGTLARSP